MSWLAGNNEHTFFLTTMESAVNWARKYSLWPYPYGTACCAIEFMAATASNYDISRFGAELVRFSPRQADLLLVLGTITVKQAPILKQIYEQMAEPKWVIAVGVCASSGGFYYNYHTMPGIDCIIPVDVYVPGCPPRPEALLNGILELHKRIEKEGFDRDRGKAKGNFYTCQESESFIETPSYAAEEYLRRKGKNPDNYGPGQGGRVLGKRKILEEIVKKGR